MNKYEKRVRAINATPFKLALAVTGGGQSFIHEFVKFGGASATIVDFQFPYAKEMQERYCRRPITKYVSEEVARWMAVQAYSNCLKACDAEYAIGIGVTCSIATDNEREGRTHKFYIARHTQKETTVSYMELCQGMTRQEEEEMLCDYLFIQVLEAVWSAMDVATLANLADSEWYSTPSTLINSDGQHATADMFFSAVPDTMTKLVLAPGSYNPFHTGHDEMLTLATEILGVKPILELTMSNADKGSLDWIDVKNRVATIPLENFLPKYATIVSSARTFLDKAREFARPDRAIIFVIGADTWDRVLDPKYAGEMEELSEYFTDLHVYFLVFPRNGNDGQYNEFMSKRRIYDERTKLHTNNLSSTAIREGK